MKKLVFLVFLAVIAVAVSAAPVLLVGSLQAVNNTTFTSNTNILSLNFPTPQVLLVTHGALANTNDVVLAAQSSVDNTNWATFATIRMTTNATTELIQGYNYPLTNYFRLLITTTNSQNVGVQYGQ